MAKKNYLPFMRRQYFVIAATSRDYARIPIFSTGGGNRVILSDFSVWQRTGTSLTNPLLMRIGVVGYKYFTEDFQTVQSYHNGERPLCSCWKFPRPYRIYPGQRMRAIVTRAGFDDKDRYAAIMFNGVREKDNKPIMLYDSDESAAGATVIGSLNDETMACPHDSSVLLHSVTIPEWVLNPVSSRGPQVQIFGPDDRQWVESISYDVAAPANLNDRILDPPVNVMKLGERNGWVLSSSQTFTAEFLNDGASEKTVFLTLRGVVEVDE